MSNEYLPLPNDEDPLYGTPGYYKSAAENPNSPHYKYPASISSTGPVGSFNAQAQPGAHLPSPDPNAYLPSPMLRPGESSPYQNPGYTQNRKSIAAMGYIAPILGGAAAGSQVQPTTDASSAVLQTAGAGISGAASGAMSGAMMGAAGGPIGAAGGAAIGGIVGLVTGGIQSFLGVKAARKEKREQERIRKEIEAKEQRRYDQQRADNAEQMRYNRRVAALQAQWTAMQAAGQKLRETMRDDEHFRNVFIQQGR